MRETCNGLTLAFYRTVEHVALATNDHEKERAGKYAIRRGRRRTTIYARCTVNIAALDLTRLRCVLRSFDIARGFLSRYPLPPASHRNSYYECFDPIWRVARKQISRVVVPRRLGCVYTNTTSLFTREEEEERKRTREKGRVKHWKRGDLIETIRCANCTR